MMRYFMRQDNERAQEVGDMFLINVGTVAAMLGYELTGCVDSDGPEAWSTLYVRNGVYSHTLKVWAVREG